jgi:hypothetical protein
LISPTILNEEPGRVSDYLKEETQKAAEKFRRKRRAELGRRFIEVALLTVVGAIVVSAHDVALEVENWKKGECN